jgi:transcriptional regulator with XRE-family HTH domain
VLAERLGWSASKVSRIENGLTGISEVDVVRFARPLRRAPGRP